MTWACCCFCEIHSFVLFLPMCFNQYCGVLKLIQDSSQMHMREYPVLVSDYSLLLLLLGCEIPRLTFRDKYIYPRSLYTHNTCNHSLKPWNVSLMSCHKVGRLLFFLSFGSIFSSLRINRSFVMFKLLHCYSTH